MNAADSVPAKNRGYYVQCGLNEQHRYLHGGKVEHQKGWVPSPALALQLTMGLVSAVEYLHHALDKPIMHRDITPEK